MKNSLKYFHHSEPEIKNNYFTWCACVWIYWILPKFDFFSFEWIFGRLKRMQQIENNKLSRWFFLFGCLLLVSQAWKKKINISIWIENVVLLLILRYVDEQLSTSTYFVLYILKEKKNRWWIKVFITWIRFN